MSYLETSDQAEDHEAYRQAIRRLNFYYEEDKEVIDWWKNQADSIKRYDPDFSLVRLRPKMPFERHTTTWDDIMDEIGTEKILEEKPTLTIQDRVVELEQRTDDLLRLCDALERVIEKVHNNQKQLMKVVARIKPEVKND